MIKTIKINQLRNINSLSLSPGYFNVIVGDNGSGKSSLLEAIFLLSRGKSFRHFESKRYITHQQTQCTIWATLGNGDVLAIAKHKDPTIATKLRYNQVNIQNQATFAKLLPTLLIDPSGMDMLERGSESRRQLLDWLCFHSVEQFHSLWANHQRVLKQRNHALKLAKLCPSTSPHRHGLITQIRAWDSTLATLTHKVHAIRQEVFEKWQPQFYMQLSQLLPQYPQLQMRLLAGFDTQLPFEQVLFDRLDQDIELGYTRLGSHRADLSIGIRTGDDQHAPRELAVNVLSRGEKKLLITALKLSQLPLVCATSMHTPIVLLDDLDSELDCHARHVLLKQLSALSCQVFVSGLSKTLVDECLVNTSTMPTCLHLHQGKAMSLA